MSVFEEVTLLDVTSSELTSDEAISHADRDETLNVPYYEFV